MLKTAQRRCRRCPREDLCDRWLAGEAPGSNAFCPNAQTFRILAAPGAAFALHAASRYRVEACGADPFLVLPPDDSGGGETCARNKLNAKSPAFAVR